ncbi:MAG: DNA-processing protein DprA [Eubacteriales bacterium]|nr:DNA-processing protein DprA [Eubacteriales bacterium]
MAEERGRLCRVWLASSQSLGYKARGRLVETYGSAEAVFDRFSPDMLSIIGGKAYQELKRIRELGLPKLALAIERIGASVALPGDEAYPAVLDDIIDPPDVLFYQGVLYREERRAIALVGSRRETRYGREQAHKIARGLAENGVTVVSGLARGIDTAAHLGALEGRGRTIAVLGSGINNIYPPENRDLAERIISSGGAVISEFAPGAQPMAYHFPFRNRLVSGLCQAVMLIEAREKSGTLITVGHALAQGREVFALPGQVDVPGSRVPHQMLREGARLAASWEDILEDMGWSGPAAKAEQLEFIPPDLTNEQRRIYDALCDEPLGFEELADRTSFGVMELNAQITLMELAGLIQALPGRVFRRAH